MLVTSNSLIIAVLKKTISGLLFIDFFPWEYLTISLLRNWIASITSPMKFEQFERNIWFAQTHDLFQAILLWILEFACWNSSPEKMNKLVRFKGVPEIMSTNSRIPDCLKQTLPSCWLSFAICLIPYACAQLYQPCSGGLAQLLRPWWLSVTQVLAELLKCWFMA